MNFQKPILTFLSVVFSYTLVAQITYEPAFPNVNFNFPVEIQNAEDGTNRMFVVEQAGRIKVFPVDAGVTPGEVTTFLDITDRVSFSTGQEIGLLGLAFHPNYEQNGYFFVYYIIGNGTFSDLYNIVVSRFTVSTTDENVADVSSEEVIFQFSKNQVDSNHNGGKIAFGVDGYLYLSIGDGGGSNDPLNNSQNVNNVFGSICRIDIDLDDSNPIETNPTLPNGMYEIPNDNPLVGEPGLDEIFVYGIRNTWKFSVDKVTGTIWGGDVGQGAREEINIIEIDEINGQNYGWKRFEGNLVVNGGTSISEPVIFPVFTYDRSQGDRSITGGYVYRGSEITSLSPNINSKYIFGDYVSGRVWALDYNPTTGDASSTLLFNTTGEFVSSFGLDENGELYFSDYGSNAQLYKLVDGVSAPSGTAVNGIGSWNEVTNNTINGEVRAIETTTDGRVYLGGDFSVLEDGAINNIAVWTETNGLSTVGSTTGSINALKIGPNGNLYAAGAFSQIGGVVADNIAMYNGSTWSALGSGIDGPIAAIEIDTNGNLYVGGSFEDVNGATARNLAVWNGTSWSALTDATNSIAGTNNEIRSLAIDNAGILYAGGNFDEAGGVSANRIATWDGSNWGTLGSGTSGFVEAIVATDDAVFIGGNFALAGGQTVNRIAKWDIINSTWSALGNGLSNIVNALIHDGENLYAAGNFNLANNSPSDRIIVNNIVQWNDTNGWRPLGSNNTVGVDVKINAMAFAKDANGSNNVFTGGNFATAGIVATEDVALWRLENTLGNTDISSLDDFELYPNPTRSYVYLSRSASWSLTDALGRQINTGDSDTVSLVGLPEGIYFLNIDNKNSFKILKN